METTTARSARNLAMQGFPTGSDPTIGGAAPWLRLTPSLSTLWIASGTALGSPRVLLGFAAVSAYGASQRRHPFDRLYERGIRPLAHGRPLPENPPPRRFAMALAAAWAATTAALFATGHKKAGFVAGTLLGIAGATVASTHFCVGSWMYRQLERLRAHEGPRAA